MGTINRIRYKKVLAEIKPSRNPADEVLRSFLLEVENIVNSRPLTFVSIESGDSEALTPNHFLLGSSCDVKPPSCFTSEESILRKNWKISQQLWQAIFGEDGYETIFQHLPVGPSGFQM